MRDADARAFGLYMRHYSSKKGRAKHPHKRWGLNGRRFIGSGEHLLLLTVDGRAVFGWRRQDLRLDQQTGIECCIFRNEGVERSSDLIREADAMAFERWPGRRHFTFVNPREIRSTNPGFASWQLGGRASSSARRVD